MLDKKIEIIQMKFFLLPQIYHHNHQTLDYQEILFIELND